MNADYHYIIEQAGKAPSGHNSQPWRFAVRAEEIVLYPDLRQALPIVDPDKRELFISLGCALENLCLAAAARGYRTDIHEAADGGIAIALEKSADIAPAPLAAYIECSQTNRSAYDGRAIPADTLQAILTACKQEDGLRLQAFPVGSAESAQLCEQIMAGNRVQMADPAFKAELLSWLRFNAKQVQATRSGISYAVIGAPALPAWLSRPIVRSMLNDKRQNRLDSANIASSSHLVLLDSRADDRATWLRCGRLLQRLLLQLTEAGIAHAFLNQPCEIAALRQRLQTEPYLAGGYPQILLRIGYGKPMPYAPRKTVEEICA